LNQKEYQPGSATPAIFNELRTEETTDDADNLFREVKDFLLAYQRPNPALLIPALIALLGFAFMSATAAASQGMAGCLIVSALCLILGLAYSQNRLPLETKLNSPSLFVRNRDDFAKDRHIHQWNYRLDL
jgi:hypothetical protein